MGRSLRARPRCARPVPAKRHSPVTFHGPLSEGGHCLLAVPKALSRQQGDPAAACSFDVGHSGFVMAQGAAVTSSARRISASDAEGQVRAIQTTLQDAELEPADIGHVHAHAVWAARRPARPTAPSTTARTLGSSSRTHVTVHVEDTYRNPRKRHLRNPKRYRSLYERTSPTWPETRGLAPCRTAAHCAARSPLPAPHL